MQIVVQYVGSGGSYYLSWNGLSYFCLNRHKGDRHLPTTQRDRTSGALSRAIALFLKPEVIDLIDCFVTIRSVAQIGLKCSMITPTNIRQHAQELIEQLPGSSLPQVVEFLESLRHNIDPAQPILPENLQEQALLPIIQRRLPPEDEARLAYLRKQSESGVITEPEHQKLLEYVDRIERQDAERAEALINLFRLRNVDLKNLVNLIAS